MSLPKIGFYTSSYFYVTRNEATDVEETETAAAFVPSRSSLKSNTTAVIRIFTIGSIPKEQRIKQTTETMTQT